MIFALLPEFDATVDAIYRNDYEFTTILQKVDGIDGVYYEGSLVRMGTPSHIIGV